MEKDKLAYEHGLLGNRSSKILGGYVAEKLFVDTFLSKDVPYTQSWWFSKALDKRIFWFVEKRDLSELDRTIYAHLRDNCFQLYIENAIWVVRSLETGQIWSLPAFIETYHLKPIPEKHIEVEDSSYERDRLSQCIDYYKTEGMLGDIQRSIQIEDLFLNRYFFTSNLDLLVGRRCDSKLIPVCLEIKFKDPFSAEGREVYGIDRYQMMDEYRILERAGVLTYAVILNNTCREKIHKQSTNIFLFLEKVGKENREWIYARISKQAEYPEYMMKSKKTGFAGVKEKNRKVLCIPKDNFHQLDALQTLLDDKGLWDGEGNALPVCPQCYMRLKIRKGKFGDFWGCSGYPNCTYTKEKYPF